MLFTVDRINRMLRAEGLGRIEAGTTTNHGGPPRTNEGIACARLERRLDLSGHEGFSRYHMKGGRRVPMYLGERVNALEAVFGLAPIETKGEENAEA
jgi:hypothetical protein